VHEKHNDGGQILQKQCCSPEGFVTYLSLFLLCIIPINLMVDFPKPHTPTHLLFSFETPPSYQLAFPNFIHPSIMLVTKTPSSFPPASLVSETLFLTTTVWLLKTHPATAD
jgi:hypothetical protein